ncbi:uncharacterized protein LOC118118646 isoform X2 [Hippoglossus stenolepis]|uniref:uncharacterized protein LOC118118646 isoform X2 n=1 Tax=Hippoglossus stenolepis TaxID=195615 RepID=UPI001FAF48EA|nr:uncharacterized protein LOC118118646 isoform X2 [Hippoglossus stenolepis]
MEMGQGVPPPMTDIPAPPYPGPPAGFDIGGYEGGPPPPAVYSVQQPGYQYSQQQPQIIQSVQQPGYQYSQQQPQIVQPGRCLSPTVSQVYTVHYTLSGKKWYARVAGLWDTWNQTALAFMCLPLLYGFHEGCGALLPRVSHHPACLQTHILTLKSQPKKLKRYFNMNKVIICGTLPR